MKIVILTRHHVYSNLILKKLMEKYSDSITLVVESGVLVSKKSYPSGLWFYLKRSGIHYIFVQAIRHLLFLFLSFFCTNLTRNRNNKFYSYVGICKEKKIPIIKIADINEVNFLKKIKNFKPDLIVSMTNQILGREIINIPKYGAINFHPSPLPFYKGVSPLFWALVNKEKEFGITVHYIDEGIDTGGVIMQQSLNIFNNDTEDTLTNRSFMEGAKILVKVIDKINCEKKILSSQKKSGGTYYSFPTKSAVKKFIQNKRRFFSLREFLTG